MCFDRVDAQIERSRDFLVRFPLGDQLQNLAFARREQIERIRHVPAVIAQHRVRYAGAEIAFPFGYRANSGQQIGVGGVLQ